MHRRHHEPRSRGLRQGGCRHRRRGAPARGGPWAVTTRADPLSTLTEVAVALCSTLRLRELLVAMMERVREAMDAEACSVMLLDEATATLRWEVALGEGAGKLETLAVALGEGISGRV